MPYHMWGDTFFEKYGSDLYAAEDYVAKKVKQWTRCTLLSKEKYGSIRYEHIIPPGGHAYCLTFVLRAPWTKHTEYGSYKPILWSWNESYLYRKWTNLGWLATRYFVFKAICKWPKLTDELLSDLASHEKLVGHKIHSYYWVRCTEYDNEDEDDDNI